MSFSFLLNRDGINEPDFTIRKGRIVLSLGSEAVRDRLFTSLSTQLAEWFLQLDDGVPYYGDGAILGGKMTQAEVAALIRRRILLDPDVDFISSMQVIQAARRRVNVTTDVVLETGEPVTLET